MLADPMTRYCIRRSALRLLSSIPSACMHTKSRQFTSIASQIPRIGISRPIISPLKRRWLADEAAATQSEPEADSAAPNEAADHSIAKDSSSSSEPPKIEGQAAEAVAIDSTISQPRQDSSASESAVDAAGSAAESAGNIAAQVASSATGAAQSAAHATGFAPPQESKTVYVGNLFFDVRSDDLKKEFERAGEVVDSKIIMDSRGLSKGYVDDELYRWHCCLSRLH